MKCTRADLRKEENCFHLDWLIACSQLMLLPLVSSIPCGPAMAMETFAGLPVTAINHNHAVGRIHTACVFYDFRNTERIEEPLFGVFRNEGRS
jgi:hypothetical protein